MKMIRISATNLHETSIFSVEHTNVKKRKPHRICILSASLFICILLQLFLPAMQVQAKTTSADFITRLYEICMDRSPDPDGLNYWENNLASGEWNGAKTVEFFINSEEFQSKNLSDDGYIRILYQAILNRSGDEAGIEYWKSFFGRGIGKSGILRQFLYTSEFHALCAQYEIQVGEPGLYEPRDENFLLTEFINRLYETILERPGDPNGLNHWTGQILNQDISIESISSQFIFSEEFTAKNLDYTNFIEILYRAFMGREADLPGLEHWGKMLNTNEITRRQLFIRFVVSEEFQGIMDEIGFAPADTFILMAKGYAEDDVQILETQDKIKMDFLLEREYNPLYMRFLKIKYAKLENLDRYLSYQQKNPNFTDEKVVIFVENRRDYPFYTNTSETPDPSSLLALVNKYFYLPSNYQPSDLVLVSAGSTRKDRIGTVFGRREAVEQYERMNREMQGAIGKKVEAFNCFRSYSSQRSIYNGYVAERGVAATDLVSARAGHSEHQTGLVFDVGADGGTMRAFANSSQYAWMKENAHLYGFIIRYKTEQTPLTGYSQEEWHIRYVGEKAAGFIYHANITLEEYLTVYN